VGNSLPHGPPPAQRFGRRDRLLVTLILGVGEGDPILCIGEDGSHCGFFGVP
jgi:hypothetical protein